MAENRKHFSREEILKGLRLLSDRAKQAGKTIEITVYGGSAMVIGFQTRVSTRDVDATVKGDPAFVRVAAKEVAEEMGWPQDWLNDGVKGFTAEVGDFTPFEDMTNEDGGLRIVLASPQYLLAMKCMAMRANTTGHQGDIADIRELIRITKMRSADEVLRLVESFYPAKQIQPKVAFGLEEIFQDTGNDGGSKCKP